MDTSQYDAAIEKLSQDIEEQKKQLEATRYEIRDLIEEIAEFRSLGCFCQKSSQ